MARAKRGCHGTSFLVAFGLLVTACQTVSAAGAVHLAGPEMQGSLRDMVRL